jgi:predicted phage tail component-like protein
MSRSFSFDGNDLADYGLIVSSPGDNPFSQLVSRIQLQDRGYAFRPQRSPRQIQVDFSVTGTSRANLDSNLDNIKRIITKLVVKQLIFDTLTDRYFDAILENFTGGYRSAVLFTGRMSFICPDPVAHSITETSSDFNIDADPKTVTEVVGGSAFLLPVFTLTAGEALAAITLLVENLTTLEEISIASLTLANTEVLVIDSERWLVTKEGTAEMSNVTGKFPRLEPNITNSIKVTAFGTLGTLNITYKEAYL